MKNMPPPFKLAIACLFLERSELDFQTIWEALKPLYAGSRLLSPENLDTALQSLKAVGIVKVLTNKGAEPRYSLTEHGRAKVIKSLN